MLNIIGLVMTTVETLTKLAPRFVATWDDLQPFAVALYTEFKGAPPVGPDLAALEAKIDELAARLQVELPPAQPGDPDYVMETVAQNTRADLPHG
jgi:hypothetical protein